MDLKEHNGWTNYATWRVNLEIVDGINFVREDITSGDETLTVSDIADFIENNVVESAITAYGEVKEGLALDYARAFLGDVNYREIAQHVMENYPAIIKL